MHASGVDTVLRYAGAATDAAASDSHSATIASETEQLE